MGKGGFLVEQVTKDGVIIEDYDQSLSTSVIFDKFSKYFSRIEKYSNDKRIYVGEYKGEKYAIRCKNVTYLGNPHPHFKKRIQISDDLYEFYRIAVSMKAKPLLMGIYSYKDNTLFVEFRIDTYIEKKAHNSSAHVYVSDLAAATEDGFFQKTDYFGNKVTVFRPDLVDVFLNEVFEETSPEYYLSEVEKRDDGEKAEILNKYATIYKQSIIPKIKNFFENEKKDWYGIDCYKEMIAADYKNKFQPEWVGFFLEFEFDKYITNNELTGLVRYEQNKKKGGIDLDLFFPTIESFGDLKAHSEESRGIQGNDWKTVFDIINKRDEKSHIYYIVCEHSTEKDNIHDYEVTKFWNTAQNKDNLMSYASKMKNNVRLKRVYFLDINSSNCEYISMFKQGVNSNGKPREPKIMIEQDNLKYFVIDKIDLG